MLKIGIDKTDKTFRHFEYDDERKYGNPQVYKVLYEESGNFGEILCSNVISIKQSTNTHNHFLDIPLYSDIKNDQIEVVKEIVEEQAETKPLKTKEEKKKSKSTKTKSKTSLVPLTGEVIENKAVKLEVVPDVFVPKTYEYDVLTIDNISYVEDIKSKLNELGKDGWEVCGFQTVNKLFGCQVIIIMKKGVN